jgi:hypothetical protein
MASATKPTGLITATYEDAGSSVRIPGNVRLDVAARFGPVTSGQPRLGFFNGSTGIAFSTDKKLGGIGATADLHHHGL